MIINSVYVRSAEHSNMCKKDERTGDKAVSVYANLM